MYTETMKLEFESYSHNEQFARVVAAVFLSRINPTVEELEDVKTAVSEAVTNAVIHGYDTLTGKIVMEAELLEEDERFLFTLKIADKGVGILDVQKAREPLYTSKPSKDRSGMGFSFMEAFMDSLFVESVPGEGTTVTMTKVFEKREESMCRNESTVRLIQSAHQGDKKARDQLVADNMGLIWSIVRRFGGRGHEMEDLFQIGSIGLMKAIDKFDLTFEVQFSTYAVPMITGEIKRFLRDDGMIKVSRSLKEIAAKAKHLREELHIRLGREPTLEELAGELHICVEELAVALESGAEVESLYKIIYKGDGSAIYLVDKLEEKGNDNEKMLDRLVLKELLEALDEEERQLITMRYFCDCTQTQIAKKLGISQVQVSRLEKKILKNMRDKMQCQTHTTNTKRKV